MSGVPECLPIDHGGPIGRPFEPFPVSALEGSVVDRFDSVADRYSGRLALDDGVRSFTYSKLAVLVDDIAAAINAATVERPGPVAVLLTHEARFPAAILGVLAAGRACVPLDADYPIERNRLIATHATVAAVVSAGHLATEARALFPDLPVLDIDAIRSKPDAKPRRRPGPDDLAYVLYTSGSTGTPKGVYQNQRGLLHDIMQCVDTQHLSCEDRVALFYSPTVGSGFRIAISALLVGASLHILSPRDLKPAGLVRAIRARGITIFRSVATLFRHVVEALGANERLDSVRLVVLGGDRVDWSDFDLFKRGCPSGAGFGVHLGATECSTIYLQWYVDERVRATGPTLPVGRPVPDRKTMLLDEGGMPVADGEIGEFAVSSRYLALGYWQASEASAQFSIDPADPRTRMFKTGDLGRRRPDGLFEYVGRKDQQIKLHGYRIEPGEIESALKECAGVRDIAVVVRRNEAGIPRSLVAYVERRPGATGLQPRDLMAMLTQSVPRHMIPSSIYVLDDLPRLPSLKIDRIRLARMDCERATRRGDAHDDPPLDERAQRAGGATPWDKNQSARTMVVDALYKVSDARDNANLARQLRAPNINLPLADLGLDSLDVIEWCMEIEARSGVKVNPADLITHGSVDELVSLIVGRSRAATTSGDAPQLVRVPRDAPLPLSFTQERIWSYSQTPQSSATYAQRRRDRILGPLDVSVLRDCLSYIVKRHEILRTTFTVVDGQPTQVIHPAELVALPVFDVSAEAMPEEAATRIVKTEMAPIVDLTRGPLVRFSLIRIRESEHWLLRNSHHILCDAWSTNLLLSELSRLYTAKLDGAAPPLPECEPLQYADYATWQRTALRCDGPAYQEAIAWWKERFQQQPRPFDLPFKRSAPLDGVDPKDGRITWPVDLLLAERLTRLGRNEAVTIYVIWLAALVALLADEAGQPDIVIGTYMTNRRRAEVQNMMGDFTNLAALKFQCDLAMSFRDWLSDVRFWVTAAETRCEIPYEELRKELHGFGVTLPEVQLIYLGPMDHARGTMNFAGLSLTRPDMNSVATMPWGITIFLDEHSGIQECRTAFDAGIHDPAAVRRFIGRLCDLLDAASRRPDLSLGELLMLRETV